MGVCVPIYLNNGGTELIEFLFFNVSSFPDRIYDGKSTQLIEQCQQASHGFPPSIPWYNTTCTMTPAGALSNDS